jgi:hypothetical protein
MQRYHPGEYLEANCTAERTKPPTNLTWYINQELVRPLATKKTFLNDNVSTTEQKECSV